VVADNPATTAGPARPGSLPRPPARRPSPPATARQTTPAGYPVTCPLDGCPLTCADHALSKQHRCRPDRHPSPFHHRNRPANHADGSEHGTARSPPWWWGTPTPANHGHSTQGARERINRAILRAGGNSTRPCSAEAATKRSPYRAPPQAHRRRPCSPPLAPQAALGGLHANRRPGATRPAIAG
jgi:hypothetical protein